jgi:hypothetical protein
MDVRAMLDGLTAAAMRRDGARFAGYFTADGTYHDVFYGTFAGRAAIAQLIDDWFYRSARDLRWKMHDPVSGGRIAYAHYTFSYVSTLPEAAGRRVGFEGVSILELSAGAIASYREVANVGPALVALNFAPARVCKILARQGAELRNAWRMIGHNLT